MSERVFSIFELASDPDATLAAAREQGPVVPGDMAPLVVHHAQVRELGQSDRARPSFSDVLRRRGITSGPFFDWMSRSPLDMEGDEHRVWRSLMARTFTPRSVDVLRPFLRAEAERLTAELAARGRCDFVETFARQLPARGLCELIGVPAEDRARFGAWADTVGLGFNMILLPEKIGEVDAAITNLLDYAQELVEARRAEPRDDLVSRLAQEPDLDPEMARGSIAGLVFAGHETTKNQLGWMIVLLSEAPEEWDRVAREPERARDVIEEVMRMRSAATSFSRIALEDLEIGGRTIPKGETVIASIWSANRDPREFPRPDELAVDDNRQGVQLAFGQGAHHCLGAALARAELQEALIALSSALQCPRIEEGAQFLPALGINGPSLLPIAVTPRS